MSRARPFQWPVISFSVSCRPAVSVAAVWIVAMLATPVPAQSNAPGGFVEPATSTAIRASVMPDLPSRGKFTFPAPYNTVGVRLTNAADCGGQDHDCVNYVGYSYWRNSNNHVGSSTMLIFLTLDRARGGSGPTLFRYNKQTDQVTVVGPLFDPANPLSYATGEGWYWSGTKRNALYINNGPRLYRYDVMAHQFETVFDASVQYGADRYIWQTHTSTDDRVHSATLRSTVTFEMLGCMVYREDTQQFSFFAKIGDFDECQVDKSGRWLLIKENVDGAAGEDNRIIDLESGAETVFLDQQGAAGHSDNGYGYMVASDNWYPLPGAVRVWRFDEPLPGTPPQGQLVYQTTDWALDIGHISHANAQPDVPLSQQYACGGAAVRVSVPRANEIVCFRLDGSLQVLVVAPTMTDLDASGGDGNDYAKLPKGNLDITGQYFIWTSNTGSNRLDAFVVRVPAQLLAAAPPTVSITAPTAGAMLGGTVALSATASAAAGLGGVRFKLDGVNLGAEVRKPPFAISWNTARATNGTHTLTAVARDKDGVSSTSDGVAVTVANASAGPRRQVTWINQVNVEATGSSLKKTGGCDGCPDAGAASKQTVHGTGYLEFTASETTSLRFLGFGTGTVGQASSEIAFAFELQPGGIAEVRESGIYRADTPFKTGDVLRISIVSGAVTYSKNGVVFYQSALTAPAEMRALASLYSLSATLKSVVITSAN